jgi:hypothetical protein
VSRASQAARPTSPGKAPPATAAAAVQAVRGNTSAKAAHDVEFTALQQLYRVDQRTASAVRSMQALAGHVGPAALDAATAAAVARHVPAGPSALVESLQSRLRDSFVGELAAAAGAATAGRHAEGLGEAATSFGDGDSDGGRDDDENDELASEWMMPGFDDTSNPLAVRPSGTTFVAIRAGMEALAAGVDGQIGREDTEAWRLSDLRAALEAAHQRRKEKLNFYKRSKDVSPETGVGDAVASAASLRTSASATTVGAGTTRESKTTRPSRSRADKRHRDARSRLFGDADPFAASVLARPAPESLEQLREAYHAELVRSKRVLTEPMIAAAVVAAQREAAESAGGETADASGVLQPVASSRQLLPASSFRELRASLSSRSLRSMSTAQMGSPAPESLAAAPPSAVLSVASTKAGALASLVRVSSVRSRLQHLLPTLGGSSGGAVADASEPPSPSAGGHRLSAAARPQRAPVSESDQAVLDLRVLVGKQAHLADRAHVTQTLAFQDTWMRQVLDYEANERDIDRMRRVIASLPANVGGAGGPPGSDGLTPAGTPWRTSGRPERAKRPPSRASVAPATTTSAASPPAPVAPSAERRASYASLLLTSARGGHGEAGGAADAAGASGPRGAPADGGQTPTGVPLRVKRRESGRAGSVALSVDVGVSTGRSASTTQSREALAATDPLARKPAMTYRDIMTRAARPSLNWEAAGSGEAP